MKLTPGQVEALRTLKQLWPDTSFVLVGASALGCFLDFRWRVTNDLDISVSVELDELPARLHLLPGWSADARAEHRWLAPGGVRVDVVPAGPELRRAGVLHWPRSGNDMSLLGQRLVFEHSVEVRLTSDLTIRVAPVPVIAVLKMIAYQDQPHARVRDLVDLAHALDEHIEADDMRRFTEDVSAAVPSFELASAYLLGRDAGAVVNGEERAPVAAFLAKVRDERDPHGTQPRMARGAPISWQNDVDELLKRIDAFERGLGLAAGGRGQ